MRTIASIALLTAALIGSRAPAADFVLIMQDLEVRRVTLVSLDEQNVVYRGPGGSGISVPLGDVVAMASTARTPAWTDEGLVHLVDGQRLPGEALATQSPGDALPWQHPWLGQINVPLDDISTVRFHRDAPLPPPGDADVVLLSNGDVLEGFIAGLGDPIELELEGDGPPRLITIPLRQVASLRMVSPERPATDVRMWMIDGTVTDVSRWHIEESGRAQVQSVWHEQQRESAARLMLVEIAAILFDPNRLIPLAAIQPRQVVGPVTRYDVPPPRIVDDSAVLGMSSVEYRGPLIARYALPAGTTRFAAEAIVPEQSRAWGDLELVIRDEHNELFRTRLNAANPEQTINIELTGRELTVELEEGRYGAIQDHLILQRPMLLVE